MLSNGIVGMGGGQMYTKNKAVYMKSLGYDVQIYSGHQGSEIYRSNLFVVTACI